MYELQRDNEWYFFTPISRKYVNRFRPNRPAHNGYWKARMSSPIKDKNNEVVGYRKSMEFYEGIHPNGNKTEWKMMEYTINEALIVPLNNTNAKTCMKVPQTHTNTHKCGQLFFFGSTIQMLCAFSISLHALAHMKRGSLF
jgi:hypothetical protein